MNNYASQLAATRRSIRMCIGLAIVCGLLGIGELVSDEAQGSGSGRSTVFRLLVELFGPAGGAAFWFACAAGALLFARFLWRHASRVPGSRWYRG